jgi:transcriptional antiterminator RfaH
MKLGSDEASDPPGIPATDVAAESGAEARWYLVQCRPGQDGRALENLERQQFECYRPLYDKESLRRGRRMFLPVALFPGYLFVRLDRLHHNWLPICSTRGVFQIVRFNAYPLPVADGIITDIRHRVAAKRLREPHLVSGERVVITDGSFAGIEAIFLAYDSAKRVMLLLNIMHRQQTLGFPVKSIHKLTPYT